MLKNIRSGRDTIHSNQSFSIIHLRISDSPLPASPVNSGEPLKTIPILEPDTSILSIKCCKNNNDPSDVRGVPTENLPLESFSSCFIKSSSDFQLTPNGGLVTAIKFSGDYKISEKVMARAFYDKTMNTPYISTSFPSSTSKGGISIRFTL